MALTTGEWFEKLTSWVPSWFLATPGYQEAEFKALAKVLSTIQTDAEAVFSETFIAEADAGFLDLHGSERSTARIGGETDAAYSKRVRVLTNTAIRDQLQKLIDGTLHNGSAIIIENWMGGFYNDDRFFNESSARWIDATKIINWLSVIVPIQTGGDQAVIRAAVVKAIESAKAFGVAYDVLFEVN